MDDLRKLEREVGEWAEENFGDRYDILKSILIRNGIPEPKAEAAIEAAEPEAADPGGDIGALFTTIGSGEEDGELMHSVLKRSQGIREDDPDVGPEAEKDAVGDIIVYLADFCYRRGYDLGACVEDAWYGEVSDREWDSETRGEGRDA